MPEQWGSRPVWLIEGEGPEPSMNPWLFWISVGVVVGGIVGYVAWKFIR